MNKISVAANYLGEWGASLELTKIHEKNGLDGFLDVLTRNKIPWCLSEAPGLKRGAFIPYISLQQDAGASHVTAVEAPPIPYRALSDPHGCSTDNITLTELENKNE